MGATPSTQDDLLCLKSGSSSLKQRQAAFERLRSSFTKTLEPAARLQAVQRVQATRSDTLWPSPPSSSSSLQPTRLKDRVRGCLFGAAVGDAAGLATEFLSKQQVLEFFGDTPDFAPGRLVYPDEHRMMWPAGDWTDDTDQQILMLQSFLSTGGRANPRDFAARLVTWWRKGFSELGDESGAGLGQSTKAVLNDPSFTLDPHAAALAHTSEKPTNGGVMRTAVAGIPFYWERDVVEENAKSMCMTTHSDPRCIACCVAVSLLTSSLMAGADKDCDELEDIIEEALAAARGVLDAADRSPEWNNTAKAELAFHAHVATLADLKLDDQRTIGYTFKCLGAGLWAIRSKASFKDTLTELIKQGGDADTNAAVAGALLGCRLGYAQLPQDWIARMPNCTWLEAHAQKVLFMLRLM